MKEDFTVTFWAKCSGKGNMGWGQGSNPTSSPYAGNQGCVLCLGQISGTGNGFVISFDDNNTNQFFVCASDGTNVILNDTQNDGADHDNNYHLYMLHFDNTNEELRVYRDGSATPRDTTPYGQQVTSTAATTYDKMYMGRQNQDDIRYYIGQLADVSIWKRLLTTAEFTQLWGTFEDNTSTATNSVKGVRVDALTNQVGLLAHWKLDDLNFTNSAVATDKSKDSITNVPAGTRYEETDTRKIFRYDNTGYGSSAAGTTADIITNATNTISGVTGTGDPFTSGSELQTGCFDFEDNEIRTGNWQGLPRSDFTVAFWYKGSSHSTGGSNSPRFLAGASNTSIIEMQNNGTPEINFQLETDSGGNSVKTAHGMSTGTWYHLVFTYDASNGDMVIYKNGSALVTDTSNPHSLPIRSHSSYWYLGAGGTEYVKGLLNDIAIWNVKLPATGTNSVATLYGNGTSTVKRATSVSKSNIIAYWDGSDTSVTIPNAALPSSWKEKGTA